MPRLCLTGLVLLLSAALPATAATHLLYPDGSGDYATIQDAINGAGGGDVIELADGTYTGVGNQDMSFEGKAITVRSQSGNPAACIIDLQANAADPHRAFSFTSGEGAASVLEAITIENGYISPGGGAVYIDHSSPTISACTFRNNTAHGGGAMWVYNGSTPDILGCVFDGNACTGQNGGGLLIGQASHPLVEDCRFTGNISTTFGGAMLCYTNSEPTVRDCRFLGNEAPSTGGAVYLGWSSHAVFENCLFAANISTLGGGALRCYENSDPQLSGCTFHANSAEYGGAVYATDTSYPTLQNTIIAFSIQGEAMYFGGGALASLTCCDLYGNDGGDWVAEIASQYGIDGNFSSDPLFCDADSYDCGLQEQSPCAPENNPGCGLVGQGGVGCGSQGIEDDPSDQLQLKAYALPNPSRGRVAIHYEVPFLPGPGAEVELAIYDASGRLMRNLAPGVAEGGHHQTTWDGAGRDGQPVAEGIYFFRLKVAGNIVTRHLVILD